ncbi:PEGA domain-containing protein [Candidatus Gottesmanbacteria bacterium]|nr:PEGA domain-containing protein [Candidatus Gottesmanbacteria bacterium]
MAKKLIYSAIVICLIASASLIVIAFARGYRFDFQNNNLTSTGILAIASSPDGASVYTNGKLVTATNSSINLEPDWYDVKVVKEGYIPWQKRLRIQGEIATKISALLIPINPTLKPLTSLGVINPVLSSSQTQLAYVVPFDASASAELQRKAGIYIWNLKEGPVIPIGSGPRHIAFSNAFLDFTNAKLLWSPDERELLASFFSDDTLLSTYLLNTELIEQTPTITTNTLPTILNNWQTLVDEKNTTLMAGLPRKVRQMFDSKVANLRFAEDETKFMYDATSSATLPLIIDPPLIGANSTKENRIITPGNSYIYDLKEDKNFLIKEGTPTPTPTPSPPELLLPATPLLTEWMDRGDRNLFWYPDSKHIVVIEKDTIYIAEYDGQNKTTVYAGPFENSFVFPWPSGGRILILTNLNRAASLSPNLYAVDIR